MVESLCAANAGCNDGSLPEAVRALSPKCVEVLIRYGHDPICRNAGYDFRSPMEDILLTADPSVETMRIIETIRLLVHGGLDIRGQCQGKSWLLRAIDSPCATIATTAVLEAFMASHVNAEFNSYRTSNGMVASPLSYVLLDLHAGRGTNRDELVRILERFGARPRLYVDNEKPQPQPVDANGGVSRLALREQEQLTRRYEVLLAIYLEERLARRCEEDIALLHGQRLPVFVDERVESQEEQATKRRVNYGEEALARRRQRERYLQLMQPPTARSLRKEEILVWMHGNLCNELALGLHRGIPP